MVLNPAAWRRPLTQVRPLPRSMPAIGTAAKARDGGPRRPGIVDRECSPGAMSHRASSHNSPTPVPGSSDSGSNSQKSAIRPATVIEEPERRLRFQRRVLAQFHAIVRFVSGIVHHRAANRSDHLVRCERSEGKDPQAVRRRADADASLPKLRLRRGIRVLCPRGFNHCTRG